MTFKRASVVFLLFIALFVLTRCAQVLPLTGGPRDTTPPVLLSVTPADKSTNVPLKHFTVVFKFDEMVAVQNVSQKLIINPLVEEAPEVTARGKSVVVHFTKDLQPNTTYFLQLGTSVVDIHESNAYPELNYIFSTGPSLDSSYVTGKLSDALTDKPAGELSVMLYKDLRDSIPMTSKPDYFTRSNSEGRYFLTALKPGKYRVMAVADKNKNQQYDKGEGVGFAEPKEISADTLNLKISTGKTDRLFIKKKLQSFWGYNKYVLNDTFPNAYVVAEKNLDTDKYQYEMRNDTLEVYYRDLQMYPFQFVVKNYKDAFDTVQINIPGKAKVDSSVQKSAVRFTCRAEKGVYGVAHDAVMMNFSLPLKNVDAAKCILMYDTLRERPAFTSEKMNEEGNLVTTFYPLYKKRITNKLLPAKTYTLMCLPDAVETFWGTKNVDTLRTTFKTLSVDETSNLQVKLAIPDSIKTYVLQLLNAKGIVVQEKSAARTEEMLIWFYNLAAGDYSLRLIDDKDADQKFSAADYIKNRQAEPVFFYEKVIKVPAGWDVETEWMMTRAAKK